MYKMELDPIWIVCVLERWQPKGRVLLKDLRRLIVVKYLLDPMVAFMCWRAITYGNDTFPLANTWWDIEHGKFVPNADIETCHLPLLARPDKCADYKLQLWTASMHADTSRHFEHGVPEHSAQFDMLVQKCQYLIGAHSFDRYVPTDDECKWCNDEVTGLYGTADDGQALTTPWLMQNIALHDQPVRVNPKRHQAIQDCKAWYKHTPHERGRLLIKELCEKTDRCRIYTRSGMPIVVSIWDLMRQNPANIDNLIVGMYTAQVEFVM